MPACLPAHRRLSIDRRICCIAGFTQRRDTAIGLESVWAQLHALHASPTCAVDLREWDDDFRAYALQAIRLGPKPPQRLRIMIVAYSWGVGRGAVQLARALADEGITVERLVSCDGVYWSRWLPAALNSRRTLTIPANVRRVDMIRQATDRPRGQRLVAADPTATEIHDHGLIPGVGHAQIDNSAAFSSLAIWACR